MTFRKPPTKAIVSAAGLVLCLTTSMGAQEETFQTNLAECEQKVFNETHNTNPAPQRVSDLERMLWGTPSEGPLIPRLKKVQRELGVGKTSSDVANTETGSAEPRSTEARGTETGGTETRSTEAPNVQEGASQGSEQRPLEASISHSETLAPLDQRLRSGAVYNESLLPTRTQTGEWYRIPQWLAGSWHSETVIVTVYKDLLSDATMPASYSATNRSDETLGFQRDAAGDVWQYISIPYKTRVVGDRNYVLQYVRQEMPTRAKKKRFGTKSIATQVTVDKRTNLIVDSYQSEELSMWEAVDNLRIRKNYSLVVFAPNGHPVRLQKGYSIYQKTRQFTPIDTNNGKDIKSDFINFLKNSGWNNLVPLITTQ